MQVSQATRMLISNTIEKKGRIDLPAQGNSMFPFIREGDICRFVSCHSALLKKGDIVLFQSLNGQMVAHRLHHQKSINNEPYYVFKGDTNLGHDDPIRDDQLIGILTLIQKRKTILHVTGLTASVWSQMILATPFLSLLLRLYLNHKENTVS
jgi:signal peptidase I